MTLTWLKDSLLLVYLFALIFFVYSLYWSFLKEIILNQDMAHKSNKALILLGTTLTKLNIFKSLNIKTNISFKRNNKKKKPEFSNLLELNYKSHIKNSVF